MPQIKQENIALQEGVTYTLSLKRERLRQEVLKWTYWILLITGMAELFSI